MDDQNLFHGFARITDDEANRSHRIIYPIGLVGRSRSYDSAMLMLEWFPFSELQVWNGHAWETVFNGAVEFAGVTPC